MSRASWMGSRTRQQVCFFSFSVLVDLRVIVALSCFASSFDGLCSWLQAGVLLPSVSVAESSWVLSMIILVLDVYASEGSSQATSDVRVSLVLSAELSLSMPVYRLQLWQATFALVGFWIGCCQ